MTAATALEQYMLEKVNAERAKTGAQPLAFDGDLNESAEAHSQWMIATDTFSHTGAGGSSPQKRMADAGYAFTGSWASAENIAWASTRSPAGLQDEVDLLHTNLMNSSGHRANILNDGYREIGIGVEVGPYQSHEGAFATQNFARTGTASFLTGVAFDDKDGDRAYDPGEGLGGLNVTATGSAGTFSATTAAAGGYELALPAGSYAVTFSGGGFATSAPQQVTIGSKNVKVDLVDPAAAGTGQPVTPTPVVSTPTTTPTTPTPTPTPTTPTPTPSTPTTTPSTTDTAGGPGSAGSGNDVVTGTGGNDVLNAGAGNDRLSGGAGADTLQGGTGSDEVYGEGGNDLVQGGGDNDFVSGGAGDDRVLAEAGDDLAFGDAGDDLVNGGAGRDRMHGGEGRDTLFGEDGGDNLLGEEDNDFLGAGAGDDYLSGGLGVDSLYGEQGNDVLFGNGGDDDLNGGAGSDTFAFGRGDGRDRVADFGDRPGDEDVLAFNGGVFSGVDAALAASRQVGADVVITLDPATSVTLANVQLASLGADDFHFA